MTSTSKGKGETCGSHQLSKKHDRRRKGLESCDSWVDLFEREYARLEQEQGLEAAKAFFRERFAVTCFVCGYQGRPVAPMNCARCGQYLD